MQLSWHPPWVHRLPCCRFFKENCQGIVQIRKDVKANAKLMPEGLKMVNEEKETIGFFAIMIRVWFLQQSVPVH